MSLEELLAEEGFNKGRLKVISQKSSRLEGKSVALYPLHDQRKRGSSSGVRKKESTKSDILYARDEFPANDNVNRRKPKNNLVRQDRGLKKETGRKHERRSSLDKVQVEKFSIGSSKDFTGSEITETAHDGVIVEVGMHDNGKYSDIYLNEVYSHDSSEVDYDTRNKESGSKGQSSEKDIWADKKYGYNSNKTVSLPKSFSNTNKKSMKQPENSNRNSQNSKIFYESKSRRKADIEPNVATPALDEAAVQAIISIFSGYVKRFIKDEDFRASLREGSFASLNFVVLEEGLNKELNKESKVIENLDEAIEIAERAAEEHASGKELKKASLQLSVIAGLNSNELKDAYTSGIPNCKLSACAHLYLSVIYKLQKKDRIAAKHLLQVFCDSPFQARTTLLPDLWDQIFLPHLSHLKAWYNREADSLVNSPGQGRKLKLLEKVYHEIFDSGTYQFAVYYKDWITEGVEAPVLPSLQIPSASLHLIQQRDQDDQSIEAGSPVSSLPSQPMVSKKLYEAVFRYSTKSGTEMVDCEEESFDISARSSHYAALEGNSSSEIVKRTVQDGKPDTASHLADELKIEEPDRSCVASSSEKLSPRENFGKFHMRQEASESTHTYHELSPPRVNEIIVKRLARGTFRVQQPKNSNDHAAAALSPCRKDDLISDSLPNKFESPVEELQENCEYINGGSFFSSIPPDFMCPLTELLFEDPVTLETGQTFERSAITSWLGKGNRTCPVTGKALEFQSLPLSNFILKRVIDKWKSEHYSRLMYLTSQVGDNLELKKEIAVFILEQLLIASSQEERITNAKQLISLGGLQFLIRRFQWGNLDEKTRISALLLSCILVDSECRNHVTANIDKLSLLELLHSKQLKSRTNAVLLLTELICLNRRRDARNFLDGLQKEEIMSALHVLLFYLRSCRQEQKPQVAVLLLHLDLLVEPQRYSVYREEAVDAITMALESSLSDEKVRQKCCRALLVLGGHFSFEGKIMTEDWILKQAGFLDGPVFDSPDVEEANELFSESIATEEDVVEKNARKKWLMNLSASLLGDGSKSFLGAVSKCSVSGYPELVRVCLTTVAWLSSALDSLSDAGFQIAAFSALISGLKVCLENSEPVEHRILASMSLLNFSKFPDCRFLLMTMAEDIAIPLETLTEVTWTAKKLYAMICNQ